MTHHIPLLWCFAVTHPTSWDLGSWVMLEAAVAIPNLPPPPRYAYFLGSRPRARSPQSSWLHGATGPGDVPL